MRVKGFQGTSLLDFPGRVASLIFFGGCNLTCSFCHNPTLVLQPEQYPDYPRQVLLDELNKRIPFIDGVVISGGEPTLDPDCIDLIHDIKQLGLAVKLDTNGLRPDVLETLFDRELVDYVGFDLKTAPGRYGELHSGPVDLEALGRSIGLMRDSGVDCEFRTTCVPKFVASDDVERMGQAINGARKWVVQQVVPGHALDEALQEDEAYAADEVRRLADLGSAFVDEVMVRGV